MGSRRIKNDGGSTKTKNPVGKERSKGFCKMEIRHVFGRKNLFSDFSFQNSKSLSKNYLS